MAESVHGYLGCSNTFVRLVYIVYMMMLHSATNNCFCIYEDSYSLVYKLEISLTDLVSCFHTINNYASWVIVDSTWIMDTYQWFPQSYYDTYITLLCLLCQ